MAAKKPEPAQRLAAKKVPPKPPAKRPPPQEEFELPLEEDLPKPPRGEIPDTLPPLKREQSSGGAPIPPLRPSAPDNPDPKTGVDKEKFIAFIEDIIDTLTFKRIGLVTLLVVVGLAIFSVYENRLAILEKLVHFDGQSEAQPEITTWTLSDKSKKELQELARDTQVTFISITDVDLKKNRRSVKFFYVDNPTQFPLSPDAQRALALPQAVFDYDPKNTAQMVSILSNEFRCDPYQDTINHRFAPEYKDKIPMVCRIAIPPFVGQFVGVLTVGISPYVAGKEIPKQDIDSIRLEMSRIAVDIYLSDVIKKPLAGSS